MAWVNIKAMLLKTMQRCSTDETLLDLLDRNGIQYGIRHQVLVPGYNYNTGKEENFQLHQ